MMNTHFVNHSVGAQKKDLYRREGCLLAELIQFLAAHSYFSPRLLKKWTKRKIVTWRNRCFRKVKKTFVQIILAAKWLVRHASMSPKQQQRPLPSLLYKSFFYVQERKYENIQYITSLLIRTGTVMESSHLLFYVLKDNPFNAGQSAQSSRSLESGSQLSF